MNEGGKTFIHIGSKMAVEPFHYTQCGLDDVYLLNGFTTKETAYGPAFNIKNLEGLHRAIALKIIRDRKSLNGKEVRFLRKEMGLTQEELGRRIGVTAQQLARYEKGETPIQLAPAMLLRARFLASTLPDDETVGELKKVVDELEAHLADLVNQSASDKPIYLKAARNSEWSTVPAAA